MRAWWLGAVVALVAIRSVQAQVGASRAPSPDRAGNGAEVRGSIRDGATGEPVEGATITLGETGRGVTVARDGRYVFAGVEPGPQHIAVRRIGYEPRTLHVLVPRRGVVELDVVLRSVPTPLQPVTVHPLQLGDGALVDASMSGRARPDIIADPRLAEPDALLAMQGGAASVAPESPAGLNVRGGASDHTAYLLDGLPIFEPLHAAGILGGWSPEALEHVQLRTSAPELGGLDALSGAVDAESRAPAATFGAEGAASSRQLRLTTYGPIDLMDAGYLVAVRHGLVALGTGTQESSHVRGESGDVLVRLDAPLLGGRLRLLGYQSADEVGAASAVDAAPITSGRHQFEWSGATNGVAWIRQVERTTLRVQGWRATSDTHAAWRDDSTPLALNADRVEQGMAAQVDHATRDALSTVGVRVRDEASRYAVTRRADRAAGPAYARRGDAPLMTVYASRRQRLGGGMGATTALAVASSQGRAYGDPQLELRWHADDRLELAAGVGRSHQFAQSLRNAESAVGALFPIDLFVGAGRNGVPVARGDQAIVSAAARPASGLRLGAHAWLRALDGLALVPPVSAEPFAMTGFVTGRGRVTGASVDAAASGARVAASASYTWQRVRLRWAGGEYTPSYAARHVAEGGLALHPGVASTFSLGVTAMAGRRATPAADSFQWESCNLLDGGCEMAGSPRTRIDRLGGERLPAYMRVDVGVRRHWDMGGDGRRIAAFGTVSNVLGRRNVLTVVEPVDGAAPPHAITMRRRALLVAGLDWRL